MTQSLQQDRQILLFSVCLPRRTLAYPDFNNVFCQHFLPVRLPVRSYGYPYGPRTMENHTKKQWFCSMLTILQVSYPYGYPYDPYLKPKILFQILLLQRFCLQHLFSMPEANKMSKSGIGCTVFHQSVICESL